jgi:hypothetical protein
MERTKCAQSPLVETEPGEHHLENAGEDERGEGSKFNYLQSPTNSLRQLLNTDRWLQAEEQEVVKKKLL